MTEELFQFRLVYNAAFFNLLYKNGIEVHKSKNHPPQSPIPMEEGWFIVKAELPTGQISNHYSLKDWELFHVPEREYTSEWDEHTPNDVLHRLREYITKYQV